MTAIARSRLRARTRRWTWAWSFASICFLWLSVVEVRSAEPAPQVVTMALPPTSDLDKLADITSQFTGVSIQYNPAKLRGTVRLAVRNQVNPNELWEVFNQVLVGQGFTTVISGLPAVYQVVSLTEASSLGTALSEEDHAKLPYPPGFAVIIHPLASLGADAAVKLLSTVFTNQNGLVRTLGGDDTKIVIAAPQNKVREALLMLSLLDRPGALPGVRLIRPGRASPQTLQAAALNAWNTIGRLGEHAHPVDIQVAPDGAQLVLLAPANDIDRLESLVHDLDTAEPLDSRTYRPKFFAIEEVANLLQQLLRGDRPNAPPLDIVRDRLTNSLIIKATAAQHARILELLTTLDETPAGARRQLRTFTVKHRPAEEMAKVLTALISNGLAPDSPTTGGAGAASHATAQSPAPAAGAPVPAGAGGAATQAAPGAAQAGALGSPVLTSGIGGDSALVIAADALTNRLMVLGEPRTVSQVEALLLELDQRLPQVELEVVIVSLSESQNLTLGVELMSRIQHGALSGTVSSLFGISNVSGGVLAPSLAATGFGGLVINPGDFAAVVNALDVVKNGRSVIRSHVMVNNNTKATINSVVQQALVANNATTTGSTTSVSGTTDAGTQITVAPQISAADYVTLTYSVTQSAFVGATTKTNDGTPIPPDKTSALVSSVATIPDGFVIGLGGLASQNKGHSEQRVPLLGSIPLLGALFKSQNTVDESDHFYVFIRASVMRHARFADIEQLGEHRATEAGIADGKWPEIKPRLTK